MRVFVKIGEVEGKLVDVENGEGIVHEHEEGFMVQNRMGKLVFLVTFEKTGNFEVVFDRVIVVKRICI